MEAIYTFYVNGRFGSMAGYTTSQPAASRLPSRRTHRFWQLH